MSGYIFEWNSLETIGSKGKGMNYQHDHAKTAGRIALKYASITGLVLSVLSFAMVMM